MTTSSKAKKTATKAKPITTNKHWGTAATKYIELNKALLANKAIAAIATKAKPITTNKHEGNAKIVAQAVIADTATKYAELNKAFLSKYNKRPIFGEKRPTPVDYSKHNPVSLTDRDNAFIHAIKTVYGEKPFTANDVRCDTGNIARAVKLTMLQSLGINDGVESFKLASNKA